MTDTHDAREIANALIEMGISNSNPRGPLQVIKLTYLCHGWMLGLYHRPLSAQPVEAWRYGPVIPDVYHKLKRYGSTPITKVLGPQGEEFDEVEHDLLNQIHDRYGPYTGIELSRMTHQAGTPWHQVWSQRGRNSIIPNSLIEDYFSELANANADA